MLPAFKIERPTSVSDAVGLLAEDHVAYSGGTELLLAMKMGLLVPAALVDLKRVAGLRDVRLVGGPAGDQLVIGAGVTHDELATNQAVLARAPLLADVERRVGNARVRAQGTIGGNLCFAEPRSDVATALMALDATVSLQSSDGSRSLPVAAFLLGPYWTAREPSELLVDVRVPVPVANGVYLKFQVTERPTVGVAAVTAGVTCRLVIGAVAELPRVYDFARWDDVDADALAAELEPVPDLTGSVEYKRHVTSVFVRRAISAVRNGGQ